MKFGETPLTEAEGAILAHSLKLADRMLRKGRVLTADDLQALAAAGRDSVVAARLDPDDVDEDTAAETLAKLLAGANVRIAGAATGRVNFFAEKPGLCLVDRARVDRFNLVDDAVTLATLAPATAVETKQMVATIKIIPFAVRRETVDACAKAAADGGPLFAVAPFASHRVALIQTRLPGLKESVLDKTVETTRNRLAALGSDLVAQSRCEHASRDLVPQIAAALDGGAELVLIAGASAIVDRRDVIPAAIVAAGGAIEHFGMPVDPGNLMLVGHVGKVPVLGLPGCARSPKVNGFDWVLQRLLAGLPADAAAIRGMGVGGLLADIPSRPLPRAQATPSAARPAKPRVAGLVLAAGRSQRMGTVNKLLILVDGKPMVRHAVEAAKAAGASPILVVTGHERERVEAALQGLPLTFVHNPAYAEGISTSLRAGIAALPDTADAVLVCLGDMPRVSAAAMGRLVAAFDPAAGHGIIVPVWRGKRGNPVLWARRYFAEMRDVAGDVGARHLIGAHADAVVEIDMENDGVLTDIDTPQALAKLAATATVEV
jgi:molybdenum cofactor cytidylyltransferase